MYFYGVLLFSVFLYFGAIFSISMLDERDMLSDVTMTHFVIALALISQKEFIDFSTSLLLILFMYLVYFIGVGYTGVVSYKKFIQNENSNN